MPALTAILIDKWYLDAVADDGRAMIAYHVTASIGTVKMSAASMMWRNTDEPETRSRTTVRAGEAPVTCADKCVNWRSEPLGLQLRCRPRAEPVECVLLESEGGRIDWRAGVPSGDVEIDLGTEQWRGRGYVERMQMTIPPWRLPIRRLHWGRWIGEGETDWAVWIRWEGPEERSLVWDAAGPARESRIECDRVMWTAQDGSRRELALAQGTTLRDSPIGGAVLQGLPLLRSLAPTGLARVLNTHETKWLGRGVLTSTTQAGWAIHELVRFPEQDA